MKELRQIKHIKEVEFPSRLHGRIMHSLYLRQFRVPLLAVNGLLLLNLAVSGWYFLRHGVEPSVLSLLLLSAALSGGGIYALFRLNKAILRMSRTAISREVAPMSAESI